MNRIYMPIFYFAVVSIFQTITKWSSRQHMFKRIAKSRIIVCDIFRKTLTEKRSLRALKVSYNTLSINSVLPCFHWQQVNEHFKPVKQSGESQPCLLRNWNFSTDLKLNLYRYKFCPLKWIKERVSLYFGGDGLI